MGNRTYQYLRVVCDGQQYLLAKLMSKKKGKSVLMKVVQINSTCGSGSTGKICVAVSELLVANDIENYILYTVGSSSYPLGKKYMSAFDTKLQALRAKVCGNYGFQSRVATKRLIKYIKDIEPDIVHIHNIHSHNVLLI